MSRSKAPVIYLDTAFTRVYEKKFLFLALFVGIFFISFITLSSIGLAPLGYSLMRTGNVVLPSAPGVSDGIAVQEGEGELPVRIVIPSIGIETTVANPTATDIPSLDRALLGGAVRYPGTGALGEKGNVLMFGHSSHLPVVHNQAYKAFNDIQNLKPGDPIFVYGEEKTYVYAVEKVEQANTSTGAIPLEADGAKITLATCDNFGSKSDRFLVTAVLVSID